jgi:hypothetical protein
MAEPDVVPDEHDAPRITAAIPLVALGFFAGQGLEPSELLEGTGLELETTAGH